MAMSMKVVLAVLKELEDDKIKPSYTLVECTGYSISAIEAVIQKLRRLKIVESTRGPQGGFKLTKHPKSIWMGSLISLCSKKNVLEQFFLIQNKHMSLESFFKIYGDLLK